MKSFYAINPKRCRGRLYTRGGRFRTFPFSDMRKNLVFWMVVAYGMWSLIDLKIKV